MIQVKIMKVIFGLLIIMTFCSCLSIRDRVPYSIEEINQKEIIGTVEIQFRFFNDFNNIRLRNVNNIVYRKLLEEAKKEYKTLNVDIINITTEFNYSMWSLLPLNTNLSFGYYTPMIIKVNSKGFVVLDE